MTHTCEGARSTAGAGRVCARGAARAGAVLAIFVLPLAAAQAVLPAFTVPQAANLVFHLQSANLTPTAPGGKLAQWIDNAVCHPCPRPCPRGLRRRIRCTSVCYVWLCPRGARCPSCACALSQIVACRTFWGLTRPRRVCAGPSAAWAHCCSCAHVVLPVAPSSPAPRRHTACIGVSQSGIIGTASGTPIALSQGRYALPPCISDTVCVRARSYVRGCAPAP